MDNFKPLSANTSRDAVLFLNTQAPHIEIVEGADHRLLAAKELMEAVSCMTISNADSKSLNAVCHAAYLLLSDAHDLFNAAVYKKGGRDE